MSTNEPQYYQPLSPTNYGNQNQPPIQVDQNYSPGGNVNYRTPCNCIVCTIVVIFFTVGILASAFMIFNGALSADTKMIFFGFIPLIFTIIATILGSCISLYWKISILSTLGIIRIEQKKICSYFSKIKTIQINDLQQVIVQTDDSTSYEICGVHYNAFEVIFKLANQRQVKGCTGVIDKNGEGRKAFTVIRNGLPQRIVFGGNLAY